MSTNTPAPVITIDGPTASGKGTIASLVADRLGWAVLDSGALYRLTALSVLRSGVNANDVDAVAQLARTLNVTFDGERILLDGKEIGRASCRERGRRTVAAR